MEYWFLTIYMTWSTQTVEMKAYGPYPTPTACERGRGYIDLPARTEMIDITPCFRKYIREKS